MADNAPSSSEGPEIGSLVAEKYRVVRTLGSGGMGVVLEAQHVQLGHTVALKLLSDAAVSDAESLTRFFREAQATASLDCEHVVRVHDLGRTNSGTPFIVMERLSGRDLSELLVEWGPFSVNLALDCVRQAASGIAEAHAAGIIHRDLKPSNLFLTRRKTGQPLLKILDFGISKSATAESVSLTQTRTVVGSPLYMSPEQIRDARKVDARTDIWSLGAILFELLSGSPPFDGETLPAVCASIVADEPRAMWREDIPSEVMDIIHTCLQKNPALRFQSAAELAARLGELARPDSLSKIPLLDGASSSRPASFPPSESLGRIKAIHQDSTLAQNEGPRRLTGALDRTPGVAVSPTLSAAVPTGSKTRWPLLVGGSIAIAGLAALWVRAQTPQGVAPAPTPSAAPPSAQLEYRLTLETNPSGALVLEGERILGKTPLSIPSPAPNSTRALTIALDGYVSHSFTQGPLSADQRFSVALQPSTSKPTTEATPNEVGTQAKPTSISAARTKPSPARPAQEAPPSAPRGTHDIELKR